jgi:hypothetical protein
MRLQKSDGASGDFSNVAVFAIDRNQGPLNASDYTHVFEGFGDWCVRSPPFWPPHAPSFPPGRTFEVDMMHAAGSVKVIAHGVVVVFRRSRFWRLYFVDNFGGQSIKVREVRLYGPEEVSPPLTRLSFSQ